MAFSTDNIGKNCYINISEDENIEDSLYGTIIGYYKNTDKNEECYFVSINGNVIKIYDDNLVNIVDDGGSVTPASIVTATGQMTDEQAAATAQNIGIAPLRLTATPTAGPSESTLMSGTWSGATWEEVAAAVLASRPIQIDVAGMGPVTLLYNAVSTTLVNSNCFTTVYGGTETIAQVGLKSSGDFIAYLIALADPHVSRISGTTPTIEPRANTIYNCGELTSLTITDPPATGAYSIVFTSGSTATTTTIPAILGLEDFAAEANTLYEINVLDNRAVVGSWEVSA